MAKRVNLRSTVARVFALLFMMTATTAWAVVNSIVVTPAVPILGNMYQCTTDNGQGMGWQWKWARTFGACVTPEVNLGKQSIETFKAQVPGTYNISLDVTYPDPGMGMPKQGPTHHTTTVTIAPADKVKALAGSGLKVPTANPGSRQLIFHVYSGTNQCGTEMVGTAQERLTNAVYLGVPQPDTLWQPVAASPTFYLMGGKIFDEHFQSITPAAWSALNVGDAIWTATQEFQIVYQDPCGGFHVMDLGGWGITHKKISATEWQIE